jgi:hypothetical protein
LGTRPPNQLMVRQTFALGVLGFPAYLHTLAR